MGGGGGGGGGGEEEVKVGLRCSRQWSKVDYIPEDLCSQNSYILFHSVPLPFHMITYKICNLACLVLQCFVSWLGQCASSTLQSKYIYNSSIHLGT